ncbi:MAG: phosphoribosylamine--glycine ligase [Pseudomonadota bacterium]
MKILVVGGGGREHALFWAISASPLTEALYCAPGNAGIADVAECIDIPVTDLDGLVSFAQTQTIDLVVVGPEGPLVAGLVDRLQAVGIRAFGPTAAAAALEGSKAFMKDLCAKHGIPTAGYGVFSAPDEAKTFIQQHGAPIVVKADGLAAGKGVIIAETVQDAESAVDDMLSGNAFGGAGATVVIEEFLTGEEVSFFAIVDGKTALPLASAQDHKAAYDGDTGPNTGGMGAYSPAPVMSEAMQARVMQEIIVPTVEAMAAEGTPFKGVLFAGLMIDDSGPKLLEFNVRFGDPECQVLMMRLMSDIVPVLQGACVGVLDHVTVRWLEDAALCVVMAAQGYPGSYQSGTVIGGVSSKLLNIPPTLRPKES